MDQPGKVANPARGQLNRENNIPLSPCVPENLVSRDGFSRPVPRQPAHLHTQAESGAYLRDSSRVILEYKRIRERRWGCFNFVKRDTLKTLKDASDRCCYSLSIFSWASSLNFSKRILTHKNSRRVRACWTEGFLHSSKAFERRGARCR